MTQKLNKSKVKRKFLPKRGTSDSQQELPEFKSGIRDSLSSHISYVNFLCPSRQMQEWHHIKLPQTLCSISFKFTTQHTMMHTLHY